MLQTIRIVAIGLACVMGLWAQSAANKATINGSIYDPNQALVPNASVSIRNTSTGAVRAITSNESGFYLATFVDPGSYEIQATAQGFAPKTVAAIVNVGTTATVDIVLSISETTETIEVTETLINLAVPTLSTIVNQTAVRDLPINGRRFQDFAVLTPTVQIEPQRQQLSFAGQRGVNSNVMLDGADYTQPFFGGIRGGERSIFVITVPQSAV
ncbi:MAG: carboxypeptidase regulatory-like domain-containing protein, partial [Bryobacterales bacterium]|nr:carboxypeptidase regulatory-like domain-containing protein [Bryobacterales bacterium]